MYPVQIGTRNFSLSTRSLATLSVDFPRWQLSVDPNIIIAFLGKYMIFQYEYSSDRFEGDISSIENDTPGKE